MLHLTKEKERREVGRGGRSKKEGVGRKEMRGGETIKKRGRDKGREEGRREEEKREEGGRLEGREKRRK